MSTNLATVSAARPDVAVYGSLYMAGLFAPRPGAPSFLAPWFSYSRIPFGNTKAMRILPDWIQPTRDRGDAVRKINQTTVSDLDAASFQNLSLDPEERGFPQPVDYRQAQIVHGLGVLQAQQLATRSTLAALLNVIELVALSGGVGSTPAAPLGINVATRLGGTGEESEVVNPSTSLPFNAAGTVDLDDPDSDFSGLLKTMIEAWENRHNESPNCLCMSNAVKAAVLRNNSFLSLVDREFSFGDLTAELARFGIDMVRVGRNNKGLASDVMLLCRCDNPGGDAAQGYNCVVVGATDQIDALGDYAMGSSDVPGSPLLSSLIGYRSEKAEWGSIESIRAACNFDTDVDYRGMARAVNLFNGR